MLNKTEFNQNYEQRAAHQKSFNTQIIKSLISRLTKIFSYPIDECTHPLAKRILASNVFTICDIGCGGGNATRELLNELSEIPFIKEHAIQIKIQGIDISSQQIETAKKTSTDPRLSFETLDAEQLQGREIYDLVISLFTLHWIKDLDKVSQNIFNALKPNGQFMCFSALEKPELLQVREDFLKNPKWQFFFKDFKLEGFRSTSQDYINSFSNYFVIDDRNNIRGQTTKNYSENEFITFLMSWLPEVRHLESQQKSELAKDYVTELVQTIGSSYFQFGHLSREEKNFDVKIQFIEEYHWFFGDRLDVPLQKDNILRIVPDLTTGQRDIYRGCLFGGHKSSEPIDQYPLNSEFKYV